MSRILLPLTALGLVLGLTGPGHAEQRTNLGGGLLEFLVTGNAGPARPAQASPVQSAPAYRAPSAGYYAPQAPQPAPVAVRPVTPRAGMPAYATGYDASPLDVPEAAPRAPQPRQPQRAPEVAYAPMPRVQGMESRFEKQMVDYDGNHAAGTIVIDTPSKYLYLVQGNGKALRYGIGVGRPGFEWAGVKSVTRKAEWPSWTPPKEMLKRRPDLPKFMAGGEDNPLGARALYLGSSLYRIHGTNEPSTIGQAVSSGCIRMRNSDVIDLYDRVRVGAKVIVI